VFFVEAGHVGMSGWGIIASVVITIPAELVEMLPAGANSLDPSAGIEVGIGGFKVKHFLVHP
jgi:hypothetical protein